MTINELLKSGVSNLTHSYLLQRMANSHRIIVASAIWHTKEDFFEICFKAASTTSKKMYDCVLRFYNVKDFLPEDPSKAENKVVIQELKDMVHNAQVRMYSSDPSFIYQGTWEGLDNNDLSIYKFTGEQGNSDWNDKHMNSGGLNNKEIHLTKHLTQILENIDSYLAQVAEVVKIEF